MTEKYPRRRLSNGAAIVIGMSIGVAIGASIGAITGNVELSVSLGIGLGTAGSYIYVWLVSKQESRDE